MRILLSGFGGAVKALHPRLLPETGVGVDSRNQKPGRGDLRPWRQPFTVATVPAGRKTIYRMGRDVANAGLYWLSWSTVVHAARGPIGSDASERTYFTGSGAPKVTDNLTGLVSAPYPSAARDLGVPHPATPMTLSITTEPGTADRRFQFYVDTFVTDKGEESKPGTPVSVEVRPGSTIEISDLAPAPAGNYGITTRRIYRLVAGETGAEYFRILEQSSTATVATDAALVASAIRLKTNGPDDEELRAWEMPPADGKHLTPMWNGMMAMISGRTVRLCEPYLPHAWPLAYEIAPPDVTPVALAVWDKYLLILTTGRPYVYTGSIPSQKSDEPINFEQSCVSERSPAVVGDGVCWAAPDGIAYWGARGPRLLTAGLMTREDWQALKPETMIGTQYEGAYIVFYEPSPGVLKGLAIDPTNPQGLYFLDLGYRAAYFDKLNDALYVLDGTEVRQWDAALGFMTATFKSKQYRQPRPLNFAWMEVTADVYPVTVTITASWVDARGTPRTVVQTRTVNSSVPVSLKAGFVATDWQIEVSTASSVQGIVLAQTQQELAQT